MNLSCPILYSFRRCPYAMRARLAIKYAAIEVELREIVLRSKPQQLLDVSSKATVPVIQLPDDIIIDESLDIMYWALSHKDTNHWLQKEIADDMSQLILWNDGEFKYYLDRYKYSDRYPEHDALVYRKKGEEFLTECETRLIQNCFLCSDSISLADMAIFPFIRQFAHVDLAWFQASEYSKLNRWLTLHMESALFISIMNKYSAWKTNDKVVIL